MLHCMHEILKTKLDVKSWAGDSDFMAGGGNGAGLAQDVRHQPPGDEKQE